MLNTVEDNKKKCLTRQIRFSAPYVSRTGAVKLFMMGCVARRSIDSVWLSVWKPMVIDSFGADL